MKREDVEIARSRTRIPVRPWRVKPWDFLPVGLAASPLADMTTQGMPASTAKAMKVRGIEFTGWPYARLAYLGRRFILKDIETVTLENERLRVVMAPGFGAHILEVHDKGLGVPLVLPVSAVNTSMLSVVGSWVFGGLEFNPFRYGHSVFSGEELPADEVVFADGGRGIRVHGLDEMVNMSFTVLLRLFGHALAWRVILENHLNEAQPLYWYTNIAVPASEDTLLMYAPGSRVLNHGLDPGFHQEHWPVLYGRDASRWGSHTDGIISGYFHDYRSRHMGFCDPATGAAVAHCAGTDVLRGRKLWSTGARNMGQSWFERLDEAGLDNYCEIQAGIQPVQFLFERIGPREIIRWTESILAFPFSPAGDYARAWSDFEKKARRREPAARIACAESWEVRSGSAVRRSSRQRTGWDALSVLRRPDSAVAVRLTDDAVLSSGWRGGDAWAEVLRQALARGKAGGWVRLQWAASQVVKGDLRKAWRVLSGRTDGPAMLRAQTWRLRGAILRKTGRRQEACRAAEAAVRWAPQEPMLWKEALECRRTIADSASRRRLLSRCPASVARQDVVRLEAAWLRFDLGRFDAAIRLLSEPMLDGAEGHMEPWLLWRECWVATGLRAWGRGRYAQACRAFMNASALAPQFGVGRREWDANEMPFYYRWRLAHETGERVAADTLAARLMRRRPHPGSESALYLLRLAAATGHPSAAPRRVAIERWWRAEGRLGHRTPVWAEAMMDTITRGAPSAAWRRVRPTDMMKYRAAFELQSGPTVRNEERLYGSDGIRKRK